MDYGAFSLCLASAKSHGILSAPCQHQMWEKKKLVPYLPSSKDQAQNVMKLLQGRRGRLADLGAGDGRLIFAASSAGFQCTGFEINSILVAYARSKAYWRRIPSSQVTFVKKDFWKADLSSYNNVTAFLVPGVIEVLGEKLLKELPQDALVISCRFPFPNWPQKSAVGSGLDQTFAYEISSVRSHLRKTEMKLIECCGRHCTKSGMI
ncbi:protein FAM173B isoform X3 [Poecilia reticulata]|uniref:protein FAM173B isoform X3 n=1 Tax=Poecilia reticulata TaxID=8081 RepID=UPI0004A2FDFD|nr:PREDICTED: protein FAM173B-like isoform X3 [Poecilia reticulata]